MNIWDYAFSQNNFLLICLLPPIQVECHVSAFSNLFAYFLFQKPLLIWRIMKTNVKNR